MFRLETVVLHRDRVLDVVALEIVEPHVAIGREFFNRFYFLRDERMVLFQRHHLRGDKFDVAVLHVDLDIGDIGQRPAVKGDHSVGRNEIVQGETVAPVVEVFDFRRFILAEGTIRRDFEDALRRRQRLDDVCQKELGRDVEKSQGVADRPVAPDKVVNAEHDPCRHRPVCQGVVNRIPLVVAVQHFVPEHRIVDINDRLAGHLHKLGHYAPLNKRRYFILSAIESGLATPELRVTRRGSGRAFRPARSL